MWIEVGAVILAFMYWDRKISRLEDRFTKYLDEQKENIKLIDRVLGRISERVNGLSSPDLYHIEKKLESIEEMLNRVEKIEKEEPLLDRESENETSMTHLETFQKLLEYYEQKHFESHEDFFVKFLSDFDPPKDEIIGWCKENITNPVLKEFIKKYFPGWFTYFPEI